MKTKRIVLSTLAAVTVVSAAAFSANAADKTDWKDVLCQNFTETACQQTAPSWLWDLIKDFNCKPTLPEQKPEEETPETPPTVPEQKPEEETPPVTPEQKPEEEPAPPQEEAPESSAVHPYEKEVVELVNAERAKYGLDALKLSENLCIKARVKSQDMADNNYFSHNSPTYGSPFDMMKALGVSYRSAGENIAMGYATPEAVVTAWMNSQGHRENILSEKYTQIGVGYVADGNYWTQWFIG